MNVLSHISELFSQAVFIKFNSQRYGLKVCQATVDADLANDLRLLLKRSIEREQCSLEENPCCTREMIEEKIKTL
jgi:hypothetical protein